MSTNSTPTAAKVSIVMTAYNSSRFIGKTIESLLGQTLKDFELIIIDDCSKDNTVAVIESYHDTRIRLVRNTENQGISRSRNIGLGLAHGTYIAISDHDDISLPTRLEKQAAFLDTHPDYIMVATNCIEQTGKTRRFLTAITNPAVLHWTLYQRCSLRHSSIFIRRAAMEQNGICYDRAYAYAEDFHLYHQLAQCGKLGMLDEYLVVYVIHEHNTTFSVLDDMNRNGLAFMCEQYRDYLGFIDRDEDVALVWKLCILKAPTTDIDTLLRFGKFLVEACQRFIDIQGLGETDRVLLWINTTNTWWNIVRMSAEKTGRPDLLRTARKIGPPELRFPQGDLSYERSYALSLVRQFSRKFSLLLKPFWQG